ncbi:MAG: chromosomal replication initiator protein DnaA [Candidatus Nealsonbacteria bacterium]|nr:chromosomal replication initiator protein DnaA [Candidatus Nealsonbacteria bacterium]
MTKDELWGAVLAQIQLNISQANFNTWFKDTEIISVNSSEVMVSVPNSFAKEWLENKYNKIIIKTINEVNGCKVKDVKYIVSNKETQATKKYTNTPVNSNQLEFMELNTDKETNLNPKYTFDNFVVGPFNELPHAAAQAVSQNPGTLYNPLFIYGGVGLGKTHLMQAVGNEIIKNFPNKKIRYVSVEKFTSEVVSSIRNRTMEEFKLKYRDVDVLIIDDVQFLSGKEKTQEEFFHTFNSLYEKNKQIIISSDRPPRSIQSLAERLRSRFEGGMITDVSQPDIETRLAILKTKAQEKNADFSDDVYNYIATNIQKNIRELEGALNKLIAHQKLGNQVVDLNKAESILKSAFRSSTKNTTPKKIIKAVAQFYDIKEKDMLDVSRKKEIVRPRQITMYLLRKELSCSFPFIGRKLGGKDHTTVIHSCDKIEKEIKNNETLKEEIELIKQFILSL